MTPALAGFAGFASPPATALVPSLATATPAVPVVSGPGPQHTSEHSIIAWSDEMRDFNSFRAQQNVTTGSQRRTDSVKTRSP